MKRHIDKNDTLAVRCPEIAKEWHPSHNFPLSPKDVHYGSSKVVFWQCPKGHIYEKSVEKRTKRHQGCPYCSGHRATKDNCVSTLFPDLVKEWDIEKNPGRTLDDFTKGSNFKAYWHCPKGHSYQMRICARTKGSKCPICSSQVITIDNCLATRCPDVLSDWDYELNGEMTPYNVAPGSHKTAYWRCQMGHSYQARIYARAIARCGCPRCGSEKRTSFPEQAFVYYLGFLTTARSRSILAVSKRMCTAPNGTW